MGMRTWWACFFWGDGLSLLEDSQRVHSPLFWVDADQLSGLLLAVRRRPPCELCRFAAEALPQDAGSGCCRGEPTAGGAGPPLVAPGVNLEPISMDRHCQWWESKVSLFVEACVSLLEEALGVAMVLGFLRARDYGKWCCSSPFLVCWVKWMIFFPSDKPFNA